MTWGSLSSVKKLLVCGSNSLQFNCSALVLNQNQPQGAVWRDQGWRPSRLYCRSITFQYWYEDGTHFLLFFHNFPLCSLSSFANYPPVSFLCLSSGYFLQTLFPPSQRSFQGCMQAILVDDQPADLHAVEKGTVGAFENVSLDMCAIIDRWEW